MLKLAVLYQNQINQALQEIVFDDRFKWYINDIGPELSQELEKNTWTKMQFVSVSQTAGNLIGLLEAEINRPANAVVAMRLVNFTGKPNIIFSKDIKQFFCDLFNKFNFNKIVWYVIVGNPAEKIYDKLICDHGGRVVGVYKEQCRLWDNKLYDFKAYEILKKEFTY
jgi:hypothetical protein